MSSSQQARNHETRRSDKRPSDNMKNPQTNKSEKKSGKNRLADLSFEPIKVEKLTSDNGERMTRVTFVSGSYTPVAQCVDELFSLAKDSPSVFVGHLFWHSIRPWLENSPDDIASFWKHFNTPTAYDRRMKAVEGTTSTNRNPERVIVGLAKEIHGLRSSLETGTLLSSAFPDPDQRESLQDLGLKKLAEWVMNAVMNDHEAPRRLYDSLKSKPDQKPSKDGEVFNTFVHLVGKDQRLPTKKRVRHAVGLGDDPEDYKAANKAYRKLGLNGLPEG